jgi:hypothetical protein
MLLISLAVLAASAIALPTDGRRHQDGPRRIIIDTDLLDFVSYQATYLSFADIWAFSRLMIQLLLDLQMYSRNGGKQRS